LGQYGTRDVQHYPWRKETPPRRRAFYYSDYSDDGRKVYFDGLGGIVPAQWPCCSGTLPQVAADYRVCTYFHDSEGVYVNLFIPSTLRWRQGEVAVSLAQSGSYPLGDSVTLVITTPRAKEFSVRLRIPQWAESQTLYINGTRLTTSPIPGTFALLKREWRSGDRIDLQLPRKIKLEPIEPTHPDTVAVTYGPLVLFCLASDTPRVTRQELFQATRQGLDCDKWLVNTPSGPVQLAPFWASVGASVPYQTERGYRTADPRSPKMVLIGRAPREC